MTNMFYMQSVDNLSPNLINDMLKEDWPPNANLHQSLQIHHLRNALGYPMGAPKVSVRPHTKQGSLANPHSILEERSGRLSCKGQGPSPLTRVNLH